MQIRKFLLLSVAALALTLTACPGAQDGPNTIRIWTVEGESDGAFQFVESIAKEYGNANGLEIIVQNYSVEDLRESFQTASLAGGGAQLLWTVNDHIGPFVKGNLIMSMDELPGIDIKEFVDSAMEAATLPGTNKYYAIPVSYGNHLMLMYHKDMVPTPPKTTDELITVAKKLTGGDRFGLVFNQTEPFWLVPWLGGFGGKVFADDGVTPTLNTPEMVATLQFLRDLKFVHRILPTESDYAGADTLFKEKKAAMIINGDWIMMDYAQQFGDNLGIARIPQVSATGLWPRPYTSGKYLMVSAAMRNDPEKLQKIIGLMKHFTSVESQIKLVSNLIRLPGLKKVMEQPKLIDNPLYDRLLRESFYQLEVGTPMPTVVEMRANWDAMRPKMAEVMNDSSSPAAAAQAMQQLAEQTIKATAISSN